MTPTREELKLQLNHFVKIGDLKYYIIREYKYPGGTIPQMCTLWSYTMDHYEDSKRIKLGTEDEILDYVEGLFL